MLIVRTRYPDLTPNETNVMNAICTGKSDEEVQSALSMTKIGYKKTLSNLAKKLEWSQKRGKDMPARRVRLLRVYLEEYRSVLAPKNSHPIEGLQLIEARVLRLIALGHTDEEIKKKFMVKYDHTAEYIESIKKKLFGKTTLHEDPAAERILLARWYWQRYGEIV